jgi:AcrR family transcriptional regulator
VARPRSDDKRNAILSAAIRVIASQGLSAATATIAEEAGVSNGSLFTYFETKADLLNQLYLELKAEMAAAALDGLPTKSGIRKQVLHMWAHSLSWAISNPEKRRTLAHLGVSGKWTDARCVAGVRRFPDERAGGGDDRLHDP